MIYYFSFWYREGERATRIAAFMCSATLSGAFGGCIAYGVGHMNGAAGLEGWRWLFIIEGIPSSECLAILSFVILSAMPGCGHWYSNWTILSVILGILLFFFLPSYPEHVGWLSEEEKDIQIRRMGIHSSAR